MIFIAGCARSGTSLTAGALSVCGADFGSNLVGPHSTNPKGFFECLPVRDQVLKPLLAQLGADPRGQNPLPDPAQVQAYSHNVRPDMDAALGGATAYKDAKLALVWPIIARAYPDAKWVIVRREAGAIADSCLRTPFMTAYQDRAGWLSWVAEHERRFAEMRGALNCIEVWPDTDAGAFRPMVEFCGLTFDRAAVEAFIVKEAWHAGVDA